MDTTVIFILLFVLSIFFYCFYLQPCFRVIVVEIFSTVYGVKVLLFLLLSSLFLSLLLAALRLLHLPALSLFLLRFLVFLAL